jgi:hypothetical protein
MWSMFVETVRDIRRVLEVSFLLHLSRLQYICAQSQPHASFLRQVLAFANLALLVVLSVYVCAANWHSARYQPQS